MKRVRQSLVCGVVCALVGAIVAFAPATSADALGASAAFRVRIDPAVHDAPYTGRLYVVLAREGGVEPRLMVGDWFDPAQILAVDVKDLAPGETVTIDGTQVSHPKGVGEIEPGAYVAQAFGRLNPDSPEPGRGVGDPVSAPMAVEVTEEGVSAELTLDRRVEREPFEETERIKVFGMVSPRLSAFHGREVVMRAGVRLPKGWRDEAGAVYPTVYWVSGFGGDHTSIEGLDQMLSRVPGADACLVIVPDASCYWGHSVFVDSATNGPRGAALVEELIPALEEKYHGAGGVGGVGGAERRAVTGGSSGGWAALWLQVTYPDAFGSCWAHCPDPVDFRDFQRINLYEPGANMYTDAEGIARPLARRGDEVLLTYRQFVEMESVMGAGGQIASFEATFSERGEDGGPKRLFDRATGAVDTEVARSWEPFDIRLVLERNWERLGPKLAGRVHVYAGSMDSFYLEGAVRLLAKSLEGLGSDAEVVMVEGMGHSTYPAGVRKMFQALTSEADVPQPVEADPVRSQ